MHLVLENTPFQGANWKLTSARLVIGRSEDCEIHVLDPAMSRRHVAVWLSEKGPCFEDLGSRNETLLNGETAARGILNVGDILVAGTSRFRLTRDLADAPSPQVDADPTPVTISIKRGLYLDALPSSELVRNPKTINDLYDLFVFSRTLSAATSTSGIRSILEAAIVNRFQPEFGWIVWIDSERGMRQTYPFGNPWAIEPHLELLEEALASRRGLVRKVRLNTFLERVDVSALVVPILQGERHLGGIMLCSQVSARTYADSDLEFAVGVALLVAPHIVAMQHSERLLEDNRMLRMQSQLEPKLVGESELMKGVRSRIEVSASSDLNVLVLGETGVGKEIAARLIHEHSARSGAPFVVVNCAAIPGELFESEFFGHERGAFSGAAYQRIGRMEEANNGTLFLDEVGDLSRENQARILRVIETGIFYRVGGSKEVRVDVRIVAATNKALQEPRFRSDLLHRLDGITIQMPPLRSHPEDIPVLAEYFVQQVNATRPFLPPVTLDSSALDYLMIHPWEGNVRQLRSVLLRTIALSQSSEITRSHLVKLSGVVENNNISTVVTVVKIDKLSPLSLAEVERQHIESVVRMCSGNLSAAARILRINRTTLYKKLSIFAGEELPACDE